MRLPFIKMIRRSQQNGVILVTTSGVVWAHGAKQTSQRYPEMWSDALARASELQQVEPSKVLLLGLGGGGALVAINRAYPADAVTAVEYDPAMVDIARSLHAGRAFPFPAVVLGDAKEALERLDKKYELILVDIFSGIRPSRHVDSDEFWQLVAARLVPGGVVVLNVAIDSTRMYTAQKHFRRHKAWQYGANSFCALAL